MDRLRRCRAFAGLKGIPRELQDAARVDGASEWQVLRYVVLPLLWPTMLVVTTTMVIQALKLFDLVWVMTGGRSRPMSSASLFFRESFLLGQFGVGAALAVVLLLWVVPVVALSLPLPHRRGPLDDALAAGPGAATRPAPRHRRALEHPDHRPARQLFPRRRTISTRLVAGADPPSRTTLGHLRRRLSQRGLGAPSSTR